MKEELLKLWNEFMNEKTKWMPPDELQSEKGK